MIFYTQSLTRPPHIGFGEAPGSPEVPITPHRQTGATVQAPMVVTGIPFDQPDPQTAKILRHMALHLEGIRQVSFGR